MKKYDLNLVEDELEEHEVLDSLLSKEAINHDIYDAIADFDKPFYYETGKNAEGVNYARANSTLDKRYENVIYERQHVQVPKKLLRDVKLAPIDKLVYAWIKRFTDGKTGKAIIGMEKLYNKSTISTKTIQKSIQILKKSNYLSITKKTKFNRLINKVIPYNEYRFPTEKGDDIESILHDLLYHYEITKKEKEYLIAIWSYCYLSSDHTKKILYYKPYELAQKTELNKRWLSKHYKSLMEKKILIWDEPIKGYYIDI